MRALALVVLALLSAGTAFAAEDDGGNLPQFPKIRPPQPLPEAACDTTLANNGDWLLGRWVAPQTRFEFSRAAPAIQWSLDRKGTSDEFGWQSGAIITGTVTTVTGCTARLSAGGDAFVFEGVLTDEGKLYGYATNKAGAAVRFVLRRER